MLYQLLNDAKQLDLNLKEFQGRKLLQYLDLLRQWNKVHNLCAKDSYSHMLSYHILDSISVASKIDLNGKNILDVGTGAGLPGIPLAIIADSCKATLVDQRIKKIIFVRHAVNILQLPNVVAVSDKVENLTGKFDIIISRAFSDIQHFVTITKHLRSDLGIWVAMKSDSSQFKIGDNCGDGNVIAQVYNINVPGVASKRSLVIVS